MNTLCMEVQLYTIEPRAANSYVKLVFSISLCIDRQTRLQMPYALHDASAWASDRRITNLRSRIWLSYL